MFDGFIARCSVNVMWCHLWDNNSCDSMTGSPIGLNNDVNMVQNNNFIDWKADIRY